LRNPFLLSDKTTGLDRVVLAWRKTSKSAPAKAGVKRGDLVLERQNADRT
jgi:hypothetical protein